jgi:hypothetical protein
MSGWPISSGPNVGARLARLEAQRHLLYGSPLPPDALTPVQMADGSQEIAIRPSIPQGWDFEQRRFVNHHTDKPVVCAALLARMSAFRALAHPLHHPELDRLQQCHGWVYAVGADGHPTGLPYLYATADLQDAIYAKLDRLRAWIYDLGVCGPPFQRFPMQVHQYRSLQPARFQGVYEISGAQWPGRVPVVMPYDRYPDANARFQDVLRQGPLFRP